MSLTQEIKKQGFTTIANFQIAWALSGPELKVDGICGPATAAAAEHFIDSGGRLSPHFHAEEFRCRCTCRRIRVHRDLLGSLEILRARHYQRGLTITSGYRCPAHNRAVGGVKGSLHLQGLAADIHPTIAWATMRDLRRFAGIGYQKSGLVSHVDRRDLDQEHKHSGTRDKPTMWQYAA